jgi:hypothetical protein
MRNLPRKTIKRLNFITGIALTAYLHILVLVTLHLVFHRNDSDSFAERYRSSLELGLISVNIWMW